MNARSARDRFGRLAALGLLGLAFGYIEGAVVVYLRAIAYPKGFHFPLEPVPPMLLQTEIVREVATILLLLGVAWVAARDGLRRFAVFAFCFGVWDLAYYGTLKIILDWPAGWLDWDILYLIPAPWASPVLAPVLVSIALVGAAGFVLLLEEDTPLRPRPHDWLIEVLAGTLVLLSFLWNSRAIFREESPRSFPWWLFGAGLLLGVGCFLHVVLRTRGEDPPRE